MNSTSKHCAILLFCVMIFSVAFVGIFSNLTGKSQRSVASGSSGGADAIVITTAEQLMNIGNEVYENDAGQRFLKGASL
jgi:hypothetical protein